VPSGVNSDGRSEGLRGESENTSPVVGDLPEKDWKAGEWGAEELGVELSQLIRLLEGTMTNIWTKC